MTASSATSGKKLHYERKSSGYSASSRRSQRILDLVGGPGLHVLDVGCGPGHIGAQIQSQGNTVVGSELSESAAAEARKVLDGVEVFDIEAAWPEAFQSRPFDVIVLGEILEHVFDPVAVLSEAHRALTADGHIVVTTPNFLVWIARLQVLFGRFRYQRYGLFDFGHIRFFTYDYLRQVLADAGFTIETERHIHHPARFDSVLQHWPSFFASNFVVAARKAAG